MKRIGLLLILILISYSAVRSQASSTGSSTYRIDVRGRVDGEGSDCGNSRTGGLQWIALIQQSDNSNTGRTVVQGSHAYPGSGRGIRDRDYNEPYEFSKNNLVKQIKWHTTRRSGGWSCGDTKEGWAERSISICQNTSYNFHNDLGLNQPGYTNVSVYPIVSLSIPTVKNRIISSKEYLTITLTDNIDKSYYNWEFAIGTGEYQPISANFNNKATLKLKGEDFLPESKFGETIYIRVNMGYCAGEVRTSNAIPFTYHKSAPHIIDQMFVNPSCAGYNDGYAKFKLDRPLVVGEDLKYMDGLGRKPVELDDNLWFIVPNLEGSTSGIKYNIQLAGYFNGDDLYTDGEDHKKEVTMKSPAPLTYKATDSLHIGCYNDNTGLIKLQATGGNGNYFLHHRKNNPVIERTDSIPFTAGAKTEILGLGFGKYHYYVTDNKGCFMQGSSGENQQRVTELTQPDAPLKIELLGNPIEPSGFGLKNGSIKVKVTGGTIDSNGNYKVQWKNINTGVSITQYITNVSVGSNNAIFTSKIDSIPAGKYEIFIIDDNKYTKACEASANFTLAEPDKLLASIETSSPILCNGNENGAMKANVIGGIPGGSGYTYQWFNFDKTLNDFKIMDGETTNRIQNRGDGKYKVVVKDRSRIPNTSDAIADLKEPDLVQGTVVGTAVSCFNGNDGTMTLNITGGVKRYTVYYRLSSENNTPYSSKEFEPTSGTVTIDRLFAGTYEIYVKDGNSCVAWFANGTNQEDLTELTITQPKEIIIERTEKKDPTGFGRSDGYITYKISGGTQLAGELYKYEWFDENNVAVLDVSRSVVGDAMLIKANNLPEAEYTLVIKDANYVSGGLAGCVATTSYKLFEPEELLAVAEQTATVDCHGFATGQIKVNVTGGIEIQETGKLPYIYQWVKIEDGVEIVLENQVTNIASGLLAGVYNVNITDGSTPVNTTTSNTVTIVQPPLQVTTPTLRNVSCFNGNDGFIHISVEGGVGGYKLFCKQQGVDKAFAEYAIEADNKTFKLDRLVAGKYEIFIQDANACYAKILGEDIKVIEITQPQRALAIIAMSKVEPSGFGLSNGSITLSINGGTPNPDNSYNITWKNKNGQVISTSTTGDFLNGAFVTTLENQPDGEYTVEVRDGNYNIAFPDANTCCFVITTYKLTEPAKLEVTIEETQVVSCNGRSDGELTAHGIGGYVNTNTSELPYKYGWYKKTDSGFILIPNERTSILKNRETGDYKVEIEDYSRIVNKTSINYVLVEPEILKATSTQELITCGQTIDVTAYPTGGTLPYRYEWNTGDFSQTLEGRYPGKYFVFVTDSRGCETTTVSKITTPSDLDVTGKYTDPICYRAKDGTITLTVKGGRAPYIYEWSNGATTKDLRGIGAGHYTVVVTDSDGCTFSESFILEDPEQLVVNIGEDRTLCNGQELVIEPLVKDPNTKFSWTGANNFTSTKPSVNITKEGNYYLTITDSKGCKASDDMHLKVSEIDISSEIVVASQVFVNDTIVIVNISNPEPDKIEWLFNANDPIKVTQEEQHFAKVVFNKTGNYTIGIRSHVGDCFQDIIKTVTVVEEDKILNDRFGESLIKDFYITPNPNDGNFEAVVNLNKESAIRLRVINMWNGTTTDDRTLSGQEAYRVNYSLNLVHANIYLVLLETSSGKMIQRMIAK